MPQMTELKTLRQAKDLQSRQVAEGVGISEQYYCEIENGRVPSFRLARRISEYLGYPIGRLFPSYRLNESLSDHTTTEQEAGD